ncbi:hypothetical protein BXZ70DRAFT_937537 [Cristinia sonorae]|uniref:Transcriptional regulatory protein RXT2 N-terminal domain-containing protein n=1 Tax=Cristinia sonorae TaxID=1940300 RepID=A0A8K0UNF9_9AGAR|nr:hypothetical protein BXZ70DRAFT_937537 [Cristinia sonorae]
MSRPSTSAHTQKRSSAVFEEARYEDPSFVGLPSNDINAWYYPSHGYGDDAEDDDVRFNTGTGNWGRKMNRDARWIRRGKMTAWGPAMEEWEAEERARKRIRLLVSQQPEDDDTPITLPHLRSPSPPAVSPYPPPATQHTTYTSFIMDKSVTHTYRSDLLDELEQATNGLIEGETLLRRALGRLWQVMNEDPDEGTESPVVPKREEGGDGDENDDRDERVARAPDLTPAVHKIFLSSYSGRSPPAYDSSQFTAPEVALDNLEKSMATLRELQDDDREYIERLEEIREGLGFARTQRDGVWGLVRERALKELQDVAYASTM